MPLCIRRYLVREDESRSVVASYQKLERKLKDDMASLQIGKDGVTAGNFGEFCQNLVNDFNDDADALFLGFLKERGVSDRLDGRDNSPLSFDNFFKWSINCRVPGDRLLVEVRAISEKWFPIKNPPPYFREVGDNEYYILSGGRKV